MFYILFDVAIVFPRQIPLERSSSLDNRHPYKCVIFPYAHGVTRFSV